MNESQAAEDEEVDAEQRDHGVQALAGTGEQRDPEDGQSGAGGKSSRALRAIGMSDELEWLEGRVSPRWTLRT
jgi:hypothetical protein